MKRICAYLLVVSTFFLSKNSIAQKQTDVWYFGILCGINFNSGSPVPFGSRITSSEGTAVMSDARGNLLFYTDGITVWNKGGNQMPNGFGLFGNPSTTQVLIVPNPGDTNRYYIFTLDAEDGPNGLNYSVVDMTQHADSGDVTVKNTHLRDNMTEKVCGVYACNNHDIWVMTHDFGTNAFAGYLVTDNGINPPVISNVGTVHGDVHGQMKFNSTGTKVACAIGFRDTVDLLDFNKSTGVVSNPLTMAMPSGNRVYGLEFSPDNSKLYGSYYNNLAGTSAIYQLDLTANNVPASRITVSSSLDVTYESLQLATDNKIYIAEDGPSFLSAITLPNIAGSGCAFVSNAVNCDVGNGAQAILGLPGFIQSYFNPLFPNIPCFTANFKSSDTVICSGTCISFTDLTVGTPNNWRWFFPGASIDSSNLQNPPTVCYNTSGQFDVTLIVSDGSATDTVVKHNFIIAGTHENGGLVSAVRDTICAGTSGNLSLAGNSSNVIQWQSSTTNSNYTNISGTTNAAYKTTPLQQSTYYRALVGTGNCAAVSDTLMLYVPPLLVSSFNTTQSGGLQVVFNSDSSLGAIRSYHWDFGDGQTSTESNPTHTFPKDSTYYVCLTLYDGSNCSYTFCKYTTVGVSGIATVAAQGKWNIYPDPVSDYLYISSTGAGKKIEGIDVYDVLGRTVLNSVGDINSGTIKIDASSLTHGLYILRIKTAGTDYIQKIIKL